MVEYTDIRNIPTVYAEYWMVKHFHLKGNESFIYSLFTGGIDNKDFVVKTNLDFLSYITGCSKASVKNCLSSLKDKGLITVESTKIEDVATRDKKVFNLLNKKNSSSGCLFCGLNIPGIIDKHHYPIRKKDGGTKIINLCPNCHRHFHLLSDYENNLIIKVCDSDYIIEQRKKIFLTKKNDKETVLC